MDIDEETERYLQEENKKAIETERIISSHGPYKRPKKEAMNAQFKHMMTCQAKAGEKNSLSQGLQKMLINSATDPKHCSLKRVDELKPIHLKDMYVNKVHTGFYLLCRIVGEPVYGTGILMLVEDEYGEIENVSVYDYTKSYDVEPTDVLPVLSTIIIKEPYIKIMVSNRDDYYIRVESPTDIVFVDDHSVNRWMSTEPSLTYEQLNEAGNKCFGRSEYREAIRFYNKALKANSSAAKTYSNRALVYLALKMFNEAYMDAKEASRLDPTEKSYYRMGKALYAMRQFDTAAEVFKKCSLLNEKNKQAQNELNKCEERLNEAKTGQYNMKSLIKAAKSGELRLDVADYVSSDITVCDVPNKGRGVVALKDIERGTLLVVSKAASIVYESECNTRVLKTNYYTKRPDLFTQSANISSVFFKLQHDPFFAKEFYKLYAGPDMDRTFEVPDSMVDSTRAERILTYNSFRSQEMAQSTTRNKAKRENSGTWLYPSYFNHSCVPNTTPIFLKDLLLLYASRDIKRGDELTIQYCGLGSYEERNEVCSLFGFECTCRLCELDRTDPNYATRKWIVANLKSHDKDGDNYFRLCYKLVKDSYGADRDHELMIDLHKPLNSLGNFYRQKGDYKRMAETLLELFELVKPLNPEYSSIFICMAVDAFMKARMINQAKQTWEIAKQHFIVDKDYYTFQLGFNFSKLEA